LEAHRVRAKRGRHNTFQIDAILFELPTFADQSMPIHHFEILPPLRPQRGSASPADRRDFPCFTDLVNHLDRQRAAAIEQFRRA